MFLCIGQVLTQEELQLITSKLEAAEFEDGKLTAGWHARLVKQNSQLKSSSAIANEVRTIVNQALKRNVLFQMTARPKTIRPALISRYEAGMSYGSHIDNALMGDNSPMRTDISLTLFLNDPSTYEGGELVIESTQGEQSFKLEAGDMIVYPSTTLHRVEPVTSGARLVVVTWVQSLIRNADDREMLFDLETVKRSIFEKHGKTPEFDLISKTHANLLRKWMEL